MPGTWPTLATKFGLIPCAHTRQILSMCLTLRRTPNANFTSNTPLSTVSVSFSVHPFPVVSFSFCLSAFPSLCFHLLSFHSLFLSCSLSFSLSSSLGGRPGQRVQNPNEYLACAWDMASTRNPVWACPMCSNEIKYLFSLLFSFLITWRTARPTCKTQTNT